MLEVSRYCTVEANVIAMKLVDKKNVKKISNLHKVD